MKIDFKAEVLKRKDDLIKDLSDLIKINSELTTFDPKRVEAPFGEGNREALDFMLGLGKRDGFETLNVDNYAGHIEMGSQEEFVGIVGHLDVVPAGTGWTYPPYGAEIHDGKMYGRGTEDDKGPTIAAYYAMKILNELDVDLSKRVKLVLGSDEETGWRCVDYYFERHPEEPVSGFIPDADFPLIYAEKGIVRVNLEGKFDNIELISFTGGSVVNMVPESAKAVLKTDKDLLNLFESYLKTNALNGQVTKEDDLYTLEVTGKSAHGATPELGINAIDLLNNFLVTLELNNELVNTIDKYLANETRGHKLGINYTDEEMGDLTVNFGVLDVSNDTYTISLNVRYPNGVTLEETLEKIEEKLSDTKLSIDRHSKLLYVDPKSELVTELMDVYKKHTNDLDAKPLTIGGGTFARAMPNVVAFGPHFPGRPSVIHQKDEYINIDDLILATIIYTEALYKLAK